MNARLLRWLCWPVVCLGLGSLMFATAAAQATSGINGKVADTTGGALPGVTVTLTSPALQVPSMTTVSEGDGTYRFIQLPAGTYEVKYELSGFKPSVRQNVVLAVGFIATINPSLEVGGLEETITVSGASPVVDTTNNTVTSRLSVQEMSSIPNSRRPNDLAMMTPGMMISTVPISTQIGLSGLGNSVSSGGIANYRISGEGIQQNSTSPRNVDMANVAEVDVTQSGGTADIEEAGIYVNVVAKSGGNDFHGRYAGIATGSALQTKNIDAALNAQGVTTAGQSTSYFSDINGDLGGKIVKDKLWFYGSARDRHNKIGVLGAVYGPDTPQGSNTPYLPTANNQVYNAKLSYQMTPKYQLIGFLNQEFNVDNGGILTRFVPYESSEILKYAPIIWKGEFKGTITNRLLLSALVGRDHSYPTYYAQPGYGSLPATLDLATQQNTGGHYPLDKRERSNWESKGDLTYLPGGSFLGLPGNHELKVGGTYWDVYINTAHYDATAASIPPGGNSSAGNYILVFNTLGGLAHQPSQIRMYNAPIAPNNLSTYGAAYVTDRITAGRLTMNLGFRYDRYHAWVPPQTKPAANVPLNVYSGAQDIPLIEAGTFNMPAPRAGFAYNLTQDAKTVVKGTYGWFNDEMNEAYGGDYNPNVDIITTYTWHDLNHNNLYDPGEVNTAVNGPDFLTSAGANVNIVNPNLKWQHIHELTGSFERELQSGMGLRFLYTYRKYANENQWLNIKRPFSAFSIPIASTDPGPDGKVGTADDGGPVTVYTFPASYAGAAFIGNEKQNVVDPDHFSTYELTLNKRFSQKWQATVSGTLVQNHQWVRTSISTVPGGSTSDLSAGLPQSPNDTYFPLNTTKDWTAKTTVSYVLPLDIRVASLAFFESGAWGQRTYTFPGIPQQGTVTLRLEPYGAEQGPIRKVVNVRLTKLFKFGGNKTMELNADVNNIINSNAAWSSTYQSGPTFGYASTIFPARSFQFGGAFEF